MKEVETIAILDKSFNCLGMIKFNIIIEDRRPDLSEEEAQIQLGYKYKVLIDLKIFFHSYSFVFHTLYKGSVFINDSEYKF